MEAARAFVANHTSRRGHTTEVDEIVQPAVTWEHAYPSRHEITTEAVDRESHRHHYHTTVMPLSHKVVLPERHHHNLLPFQRVHHQHDDLEATKRRVELDAAQFKDHSMTLPTTHSRNAMPAVMGIHHHHHVHETVQPIIYKETRVPEVVHTTIPIHEHHHMKAEHHPMSALPVMTMAAFEAKKTNSRIQNYEGPPREYESSLNTTFEKLGVGMRDHVLPTGRHDNDLTIKTDRRHHRPSTSRSRSSSRSDSSLSSMELPMTPRSPNKHSKPMTNFNTVPRKEVTPDRPVQIVNGESPRMSNESAGSGQRRFTNRSLRRVY